MPEIKSAEQNALALPDLVKVVVVKDDESLKRAGKAKVYCKTIRKGIIEDYKPQKAAANETHRLICEREKKALEPVEIAEIYINGQIKSYMAVIAEKRRNAEQKERDRLFRLREADEEKRRRTLEALQAGRVQEVEKIFAEPEPSQAIELPDKPKIKGVQLREHWGFEIIDSTLIPKEWWMLNDKGIGEHGRKMKDKASIPGVRFFREDIVV